MKPGYYSLVQYCPDPLRTETANIGVLLFCPQTGFLGTKLSKSIHRIKNFFGKESFDFTRVMAERKAFSSRIKFEKKRFKGFEDLSQFVNTRAGELRLSEPRSIKLEDPEKELEELFQRMVIYKTEY